MPPQRTALIVDGAAGPDETVTAVLARFGFAAATPAPSVDAALRMLQGDHADLVVVPLAGIDSLQLAALVHSQDAVGLCAQLPALHTSLVQLMPSLAQPETLLV